VEWQRTTQITMKKTFLIAAVLTVLIACSKTETPAPTPIFTSDDAKKGTYTVADQAMATGKVQTWIRFDEDNVPSAMGVTLSKSAYDAIPRNSTYSFNLPNEAKLKTPFVFLFIGKGNANALSQYNAEDVFYFGFYTIEKDDQKAIETELMLNGPSSAKYNALPVAGIIPSEYSKTGQGGILGKPWYNANSPEWGGKPFIHTMSLGTYNGDLVYYTPMVTEAAIKANPNISQSISATTKKGYFPNKYSIKQDGDNVVVTLDDFKKNL
jgi:hypothetical protein